MDRGKERDRGRDSREKAEGEGEEDNFQQILKGEQSLMQDLILHGSQDHDLSGNRIRSSTD